MKKNVKLFKSWYMKNWCVLNYVKLYKILSNWSSIVRKRVLFIGQFRSLKMEIINRDKTQLVRNEIWENGQITRHDSI